MSHHSAHHQGPSRGASRPHVKWITLIGAVLMIGAMALYVLTMDEAEVPGQPAGQPVPASP